MSSTRTVTRTPEQNREYLQSHVQKWRLKAIAHYGSKCVCCGESDPIFLQFSHKNRDGGKERGPRGQQIYKGKWYRILATTPTRTDLELLCANCHVAEHRGGCPHKLTNLDKAARV